jgi:hypothetical protein
MKAALLAFLVALSTSVWSYYKLQSRTGYGNTQTTLKGAVAIFIIVFIVIFTIGSLLFSGQN